MSRYRESALLCRSESCDIFCCLVDVSPPDRSLLQEPKLQKLCDGIIMTVKAQLRLHLGVCLLADRRRTAPAPNELENTWRLVRGVGDKQLICSCRCSASTLQSEFYEESIDF
ncbi:uncharacterized [Tachysurus ichikawai]